MALIIKIEMKGEVLTFPLSDKPVTLGRSSKCDVPIDDPAASRKHCTISIADGIVTIKDLGSTNGILVNNYRVTDDYIMIGDRVTIGAVVITLDHTQMTPEEKSLHMKQVVSVKKHRDITLARTKGK